MHALNNVLVNLDSYLGGFGHNYYMYQDKHKVWRPIVWDLNLAFGGFPFVSMTGSKLSTADLIQLDPYQGMDDPNRPLISVLLKTEKYRHVYTNQMQTILEEHFLNDFYKARIQHFDKILSPYLQRNGKQLYSYENFKANQKQKVKLGNVEMIGLEQLMDARKTFLSRVLFPEGAEAQPLKDWQFVAADTSDASPPDSIVLDSLALISFQDSVSSIDRSWELSVEGKGLAKVIVFVQFAKKGPFIPFGMQLKEGRWTFRRDQPEQPRKFYFQGHSKEKSFLFPKNAGYYSIKREN